MANRGSVWAAIYGEDEEMDGTTQQTSDKVSIWLWHLYPPLNDTDYAAADTDSANNRRFLSAQPPFATDDDSNRPPINKSQVYEANPLVPEPSDLRLPNQAPSRHEIAHAQRSRELFSGAIVGEEGVDSRTNRQKIPRTLNNPVQAQLRGRPLRPTTRERGDRYGQADLRADMADVADFAFQDDARRCEMFLDALSTNFKICQEKGRKDVVAKMAKELEKAADAVNESS